MLVYYIAKIKCCQHMTFSILSKFNKNFVLQTVQRYFNWLIRLLMSLYPSPAKIANVVFHSNSFFFLLLQHMTSFSVIKRVLCSQLMLYLRRTFILQHFFLPYLKKLPCYNILPEPDVYVLPHLPMQCEESVSFFPSPSLLITGY